MARMGRRGSGVSRLKRAVLVRLMDDDRWCFVCHASVSYEETTMSLVRKIYIDSRTCSGDPADFTATLPEPIRAHPCRAVCISA